MSRISRYKESIEKFFKGKSFITEINETYRDQILEISPQTDYFISIVLLTVMNNVSKKHNLSLHGYFMASGIESLYILNKILENKHYYENKLGQSELFRLILIIHNNVYKSLSQNIDTISTHLQKEKVLKINSLATKYLTAKLESLNCFFSEPNLPWKKNDLLKYKFEDKTLIQKINNLKVYSKEDLVKYIENRLGAICKITLVIGWLLGNGDEKNIPVLEKLAVYMAKMIKVAYDFNSLEDDIKIGNKYTLNSVITLGFQESFELFQYNREKFVEGCMMLDIHTNTIKEIIDVLESRIDIYIDNTATQTESVN